MDPYNTALNKPDPWKAVRVVKPRSNEMKVEHKSEPYHTGYEAHEQGDERSTNPHGKGSWDRDEWFKGWDAAND